MSGENNKILLKDAKENINEKISHIYKWEDNIIKLSILLKLF